MKTTSSVHDCRERKREGSCSLVARLAPTPAAAACAPTAGTRAPAAAAPASPPRRHPGAAGWRGPRAATAVTSRGCGPGRLRGAALGAVRAGPCSAGDAEGDRYNIDITQREHGPGTPGCAAPLRTPARGAAGRRWPWGRSRSWGGRRGGAEARDKRQCRTCPRLDALTDARRGAVRRGLGSPRGPAFRTGPDSPEHDGGRTKTSLRQVPPGPRPSPTEAGLWLAPEHDDEPRFLRAQREAACARGGAGGTLR